MNRITLHSLLVMVFAVITPVCAMQDRPSQLVPVDGLTGADGLRPNFDEVDAVIARNHGDEYKDARMAIYRQLFLAGASMQSQTTTTQVVAGQQLNIGSLLARMNALEQASLTAQQKLSELEVLFSQSVGSNETVKELFVAEKARLEAVVAGLLRSHTDHASSQARLDQQIISLTQDMQRHGGSIQELSNRTQEIVRSVAVLEGHVSRLKLSSLAAWMREKIESAESALAKGANGYQQHAFIALELGLAGYLACRMLLKVQSVVPVRLPGMHVVQGLEKVFAGHLAVLGCVYTKSTIVPFLQQVNTGITQLYNRVYDHLTAQPRATIAATASVGALIALAYYSPRPSLKKVIGLLNRVPAPILSIMP